MRKYIGRIMMGLMLAPLAISSCKKSFLEVVPKGRLIATTVQDYDMLMNTAALYQYNAATVWQITMLLGDEVGAEEDYFEEDENESKALFRWEDVVYRPTDEPQFLPTVLNNIYVVNKIVNEVMDAADGSDQQKQQIQAEAKASRAFIYFQLLNLYGKPYVASTASTDLSFPINTVTDITATDFKRATVQEMYDFIIKDLTEAIPYLRIQPPVATRWSKAAAEGMLGKVYLFMGKSGDALTQFNAAFDDISKMAVMPRLYDYNATLAPGGSFLPIGASDGPGSPYLNETDLTESVVAVMSYQGRSKGNGYGNEYLSINAETVALFGASDLRLKFYTDLQQDEETPLEGGRLRKYGVNYARVGLQLSELYLLRAEAKARTNELPGAVADVEMLRKSRMPVADASVPGATATNQNALIKFIIDERTREFAAEGYRWYDMRRLYNDPLFTGQPAATHNIYATGGGVETITLRPERLTLRLPQSYLDKNPGMPNNP